MRMITDWDDAYNNRKYSTDVDERVSNWNAEAAAFRSEHPNSELAVAYGGHERERIDFFYPKDEPAGLAFFVHGGYWRSFDNSSWSHLARGPLAKGWAVAMPSYRLAPDVGIHQITEAIRRALTVAGSKVSGTIRLAGHSAGGHLVSRMLCADIELPVEIEERIERTVSISGVHDLRPLLKTLMNDDFKMDLADAATESPALLAPRPGVQIACAVGSNERPEFIRQNALLANVWTGLGARTSEHQLPGYDHFTIVETLEDPKSELCGILLA